MTTATGSCARHSDDRGEPSIGALLPCNGVLREERGETIVEALKPMAALGIVDGEVVRAVNEEATARLERAIAPLAAPA
jgi:hypothetical protein